MPDLDEYLISTDILTDIADAIRDKLGTSVTYKPINMADRIMEIGGGVTPTGNIEITQQTGTDVTNYATASVRSSSISLNTPTINANGLVTASATVDTTGWTAAAPSNATLQLSTQAAKTVTPSTTSQTAVAAGTYCTGAITVGAISTETKTVTANGDVTPTSGKYLTKVTVSIPYFDGTVI